MQSLQAATATKKRPSGRSYFHILPRSLPLLRHGFALASKLSPDATAILADALFFRPTKLKKRPEELAALREAQRFQFEVFGRPVTAYSFGQGPPVLLVHGWAGHAGQMLPLAGALTGKGFRAVSVDMPGHGASPGRHSSIIHFIETLRVLAEISGPLRGVVAHSMGCAAVTLALDRGLEVPRAVFFAPPDTFEVYWSRFRQALGVPLHVWELLRARAERRLQTTFDELLPIRCAPRMRAQLLAIHDVHDRETPYSGAVALTGAWPGATLLSVEGLGHNRILRNPELVDEAAAFFHTL